MGANGGAVGKKFGLEHQSDKRIPPGGVVRIDDQRRPSAGGRPAPRNAQGMKMAAHITARIPGEPVRSSRETAGRAAVHGGSARARPDRRFGRASVDTGASPDIESRSGSVCKMLFTIIDRVHAVPPPRVPPACPATRIPFCPLTTPSWSSASAAIQPLISTIGMPGPGCAAPPAR